MYALGSAVLVVGFFMAAMVARLTKLGTKHTPAAGGQFKVAYTPSSANQDPRVNEQPGEPPKPAAAERDGLPTSLDDHAPTAAEQQMAEPPPQIGEQSTATSEQAPAPYPIAHEPSHPEPLTHEERTDSPHKTPPPPPFLSLDARLGSGSFVITDVGGQSRASEHVAAAAAAAARRSLGGTGMLPKSPRLEANKPPPRLAASHFAYTHPGGSKPLHATNQDVHFHLEIDRYNQVFGVLDGHGRDNGALVANVAAQAIKGFLADRFDELRVDAEETLAGAFEVAHEACREAVLGAAKRYKAVRGVVVDEWLDNRGNTRLDVVDGGTTATVIVLLDGKTLIHAQVGDSSALVGGTLRRGGTAFMESIAEHSPTNMGEYARVRASGSLARFAYDTPELPNGADPVRIYRKRGSSSSSAGAAAASASPAALRNSIHSIEVDPLSRERAINLGVCSKNQRGDLPTVLLTPETDGKFPGLVLPLKIAMTRAIGDFYLQTVGLTWRPEVRTWDLPSLLATGFSPGGSPPLRGDGPGPLREMRLILASDGLWDLFEDHRQVFEGIAPPPPLSAAATKTKPTTTSSTPPVQRLDFDAVMEEEADRAACRDVAKAFFERAIKRSVEMFDDTADNMTGIVVYLKDDSEGFAS